MSEIAELMMKRTHPDMAKKKAIWSLIQQSYKGGTDYSPSNLWRYPRESDKHYEARKERMTYVNHVQPLADMIAGFLFAEKPARKIANSDVEALKDRINRRKSIEEFALEVGTQSLMLTCGVLVDMPGVPEDVSVRTKADERALGLTPYAVLYVGSQICDFSMDEHGDLVWVLLDTSRTESQDPTKPARDINSRRLWTVDGWTDFEDCGPESRANERYIQTGEGSHDLGFVPFRFLNWRDVDGNGISETPFEDIALQDRKHCNTLSYADEMVAAGTFKMLTWPGEVPEKIIAAGTGGLSILEYEAGGSPPSFIGAGLEELGPFLALLGKYETYMLEKLGLNPDHDKTFVQSGVAKSQEFEKCESILRSGASMMQQAETWIFETCAAWMGISDPGVSIEYNRQFQSEDVDVQLSRLKGIFQFVSGEVKDEILKAMVQKATRDMNDDDQERIMKMLDKAIAEALAKRKEAQKAPPSPDPAQQEANARANQQQSDPPSTDGQPFAA